MSTAKLSFLLVGVLLIAGGLWWWGGRVSPQAPVPITDLTKVTMTTSTEASSGGSTAVFKTSMGEFTVELYPDKAPKTVENFVKLSKSGFYNGTKFHRVIKDFMNQGGDPLSKDDTMKDRWGTGGPGYQFEDEFNDVKLVSGVLAMANSGPNSNGSQFFVVTAQATPWLDGAHTAFGKVVSGMDVVLTINHVETESPGRLDRPIEAVIVESIEIL